MIVDANTVMRHYALGSKSGEVDSYTRNHAERLAYSYSMIPELPRNFSALLLGSWGRETPLLTSEFSCGKAVAICAPERGSSPCKTINFDGVSGSSSSECQLYSVDVERNEIPDHLNEFDISILWEVIEHMQFDPAFAIWQGIRALKIGGIISITTPNALWYQHTVNHVLGVNSVSLRIRRQYEFSTHWREYSPSELADLVESMGCRPILVSSFLDSGPQSFKSRLLRKTIDILRTGSRNGRCSTGRHSMLIAEKVREGAPSRPKWLYPD